MINDLNSLSSIGAVASGHFVYKAGYMHGNQYVNKEVFSLMGAKKLTYTLQAMASAAMKKGLSFDGIDQVGVIGPAYGAIPFSLTVAAYLEIFFPKTKFFPARTELRVVDGRKVHYLPEKLAASYREKVFIGVEDIVNNGTTIREIKKVFAEEAGAEVISFMALVNRAGQTAKSLGLQYFYPLIELDLGQYDVRSEGCELCRRGLPIDSKLGKGSEWVQMFGHPPYAEKQDFSFFWNKN